MLVEDLLTAFFVASFVVVRCGGFGCLGLGALDFSTDTKVK